MTSITLSCHYCKKYFTREISEYNSKRKKGVKHFFCSRKCHYKNICLKVPESCHNCGKMFLKRRWKERKNSLHFCSKSCHISWQRDDGGSTTRYCEVCGKEFRAMRSSQKRRCSLECFAAARKITTSKKIGLVEGREELRSYKRGAPPEWHVYLHKRGGMVWVRKALVIAEKMLRRKISKFDRIVFKDGNRNNLSISNIDVITGRGQYLYVCKACKNPVYIDSFERKGKSGICKKCYHKTILPSNCLITLEQAYLIRTLHSIGMDKATLAIWYNVPYDLIVRLIRRGHSYKREILAMSIRKNVKKKWEVMMEEYDRLSKEGRLIAYDKAIILKSVFEDNEFQADMKLKTVDPREFMMEKNRDSFANFSELMQMLKVFPQRNQWLHGDLSKMRLEAMQTMKEEIREANKGKKQERVRITQTEYRELQQRYEKALLEIEQLKSQLADKEKLIAILEGHPEVTPRRTRKTA